MEESWENWHLHQEMDYEGGEDDYFVDKSNIEEDEEFLRQILLQAPAFSSETDSDYHSLHALEQGNMVKSNSSNSIVSSHQQEQQVPKKPRTYILSFDNSTMIPATPEPCIDEGKSLGRKRNRRCSESGSTLPNKKQEQAQINSTETETRTNSQVQGTKRARTTSQTIDHILAERKRRQELTERFIALSATIPGLSKTDKASVLKAAIDYVKQLKERVDELEKQEEKKGFETVIVIKKPENLRGNEDTSSNETSSDHDNSSILPEIGARAMGKEVLIEIHCEKENGIQLKILDHLENLHLSVNGSCVLPFGNSALSVTVTAQMGDAYGMTMNDLVTSLKQVLLKSQMSSDSDPY